MAYVTETGGTGLMNHDKVYWAKEEGGLVEVFQVAHIPVLAAITLGTRAGAGLDAGVRR